MFTPQRCEALIVANASSFHFRMSASFISNYVMLWPGKLGKIHHVAPTYSSLATVLHNNCRSDLVTLMFEHVETFCAIFVMLHKCFLV